MACPIPYCPLNNGKPDTQLVSDVQIGLMCLSIRLQPSLVLTAGEGMGDGWRASQVPGCDVMATLHLL